MYPVCHTCPYLSELILPLVAHVLLYYLGFSWRSGYVEVSKGLDQMRCTIDYPRPLTPQNFCSHRSYWVDLAVFRGKIAKELSELGVLVGQYGQYPQAVDS